MGACKHACMCVCQALWAALHTPKNSEEHNLNISDNGGDKVFFSQYILQRCVEGTEITTNYGVVTKKKKDSCDTYIILNTLHCSVVFWSTFLLVSDV